MNSCDYSSVWRQKSAYYFNGISHEQMNLHQLDTFKSPVKIAVDYSLPISFYVGNDGYCSLFSLEDTLREIGRSPLPTSSDSRGRNVGEVSSILHFNNWLLVSNARGVTQYEVNCNEVARGQNLNDFMQMAYTEQKQPSDLGEPLATFYSFDIQIPSWQHASHSIIEKSKLKEKDFEKEKQLVREYFSSNKEKFQATYKAFYDHKQDSKFQELPMSGPKTDIIRQISFNYRVPNSFQSISGAQWFNWDIATHKLKYNGIGDGFQLLTIDTSPIFKDVVAMGSYGGNIILQDLRAKKEIKTFRPNFMHPVTNLKFSPIIQPLLATTTDDFNVKLWDLRGACEKPFLELSGHTNEITSIQFSNHRCDFLFTSSLDSTIRIWNINNQCPPHHCLQSINPCKLPVVNMTAGCNRIDSFYYSCIDGTTGACILKPKFFQPVIPHQLKTEYERNCEELMYFRQNQQLYSNILQEVHKVLEVKSNVDIIAPLLKLATNKNFDLSHGFSNTPIEEVISYFSYFLSSAIPNSLIQAPESSQLSDAKRYTLFVKVLGGIQKHDASILRSEKRNILATLESFSREDILNIVMVLASASFEDALEVGNSYLRLLIKNKKLDKFLDVGYFLLYPTIFDDPTKEFQVLSKIDHNARTRLRTSLNNGQKITQEITDYVAILSTAANDEPNSIQTMYDTLKKHDLFLSMFLFRTYISICLFTCQWSNCFLFATQTAKFVDGFPLKDIIYEWLENEFNKRFSEGISYTLDEKNLTPGNCARVIKAISEVIIISSHAEDLPESCTDVINNNIKLVKQKLKKLLFEGGAQSMLEKTPLKIALAVRASIDLTDRTLPLQVKQNKKLNEIMTLLTTVINQSPQIAN